MIFIISNMIIMKKTIITAISMLLCVGLSLSASAATLTPSQTEEQAVMAQLLEKASIQREAIAANALFQSELCVDDDGELVYPKSFAGDYIDDDGNLIIQISSDDFSEYEYLQDEYSCVRFNRVEYSNEYLREVLDEYLDSYDENDDVFYKAYIDVELNRAIVEVDEKTLSLKSENDDDSPLVFRLGSPIVACSTSKESSTLATKTASITSGDILVNKKSNGIFDLFNHVQFSAGIGMTTTSGKDALVACGHMMNVNDKVFLDNTYIGDVTYVSFSDLALGDYSIITLNENGSSTYKLYGRDSNAETNTFTISENKGTYTPVKGEYVFKCTKNSGVAAFVVEALNVETRVVQNDSDEGVRIKGQTSVGLMDDKYMGITGATVKPGDSGGGVFYHSTSGDYFCGIMSAYSTETLNLYYTPVSRVTSHGTIKAKK